MGEIRQKQRSKKTKGTGVTDRERDEAWERIKSAAKQHGIEIREQDWRKLGRAKPA